MTVTGGRFNYPLMLNLRDRLVAVIGAGTVGRRKLQRLLEVGARIRLVDPQLAGNPYPSELVESVGRGFDSADLQGVLLVFACTDSPLVNRRVAVAAAQRQLLCCCADQPQGGDFALPAVLTRGNLTIAVATGGDSPALAALLRDRLEAQVPDSWGRTLEIMAEVRRKWLTEQIDDKYNRQVLRSFSLDRLLTLVEQGKLSEIDQLLKDAFGDAFSLEQLRLQSPGGKS